MPLITAIEPQKKRLGRFNVFLNDKFAFGLNEETLIRNNLKKNMRLSDAKIKKIIKETIFSNLLDQSLRFLSFRPRSEKEMTEYLANKISKKEFIKYNQAYHSPLIKQVTDKLKRYKYIDDKEFAKWWLSARVHSKKGPKLLKYELLKKGIERETVDSTIAHFPNQVNLAKAAIEKKVKRWTNLSKLEFKNKIYQNLAMRGFEFDVIKDVFAHYQKKR